ETDDPAKPVSREELRRQGAAPGGERMVGQSRDQNAEGDRQRLAEAAGQNQRQQLGLVADFGQSDRKRGGEEGFHEGNSDGSGATMIVASPLPPDPGGAHPVFGKTMPAVSPEAADSPVGSCPRHEIPLPV